jgi:hypothetical protein
MILRRHLAQLEQCRLAVGFFVERVRKAQCQDATGQVLVKSHDAPSGRLVAHLPQHAE